MTSSDPQATRRAEFRYPVLAARRPNPVVMAWRWRYEVSGAACAVGGALTVILSCGPGWLVVGISGLVALVAGSPAGREFIVARAWWMITPHRIRVGCAQAWIRSRSGRIPIVILTTRQPFGERLVLWCPAGTSADDLLAARGTLAAACWASEVRIVPDPRYAHLVTVDVIRWGRATS
jgi:hypothetical protein